MASPPTPVRAGMDLLPIVLPDSPFYGTARRAWNRHADLRPAAVCVATRVEQVQAAIGYARQHGLRVAPLTTGHLAAALPDLRDTVLLRIALHDGDMVVDPAARTVRVQAGAEWGEVVEALAPYGLAAMHPSSPSVGVIGYLLGGGLSFYARAHGLAVNCVRALEVVTADGTFRRVDVDHDADLFYALRGGGGTFGVVTAVELGLLAYPEVTGGTTFFPGGDTGALLRAWRDWSLAAPETVTTIFRLLNLPPLPDVPGPLRGVPTASVSGVALREDDAVELDRCLRAVSDPIFGGFGSMPSAEVVRLLGESEAPAPVVGDAILLDRLDDLAVEAFVRLTGPGSPLVAAGLYHLGGALASPPAHAGARGHLEGNYLLFGAGIGDSPRSAAEIDAHLDRYFGGLAPGATGTRYANLAERWRSLETCVPPESLERLRRIHRAVDPDRLFVCPHPVSCLDQ